MRGVIGWIGHVLSTVVSYQGSSRVDYVAPSGQTGYGHTWASAEEEEEVNRTGKKKKKKKKIKVKN
jgi:hypothetical protein